MLPEAWSLKYESLSVNPLSAKVQDPHDPLYNTGAVYVVYLYSLIFLNM